MAGAPEGDGAGVAAPMLLASWAPEPLSVLVLLAAGAAYAAALLRLRRRGRRWPPGRVAAFASGLLVLAISTQSELGVARARFAVDAVAHVLVGMAAPALLAAGAPLTLALQASRRERRTALLRALQLPPLAAVTHPLVGWLVFVVSPFVLYLSPVYGVTLRNDLAHDLAHLHFLLGGLAYFVPVVGADRLRWRPPPPARLGSLVLTIPFHSFLGLALLTGDRPVDPSLTLADQHLGGGLLWLGGELVVVAVAAAVVLEWVREDERVSRREDAAVARSRRGG